MILNISELRSLRNVGVNVPDHKLAPVIEEAEKHDVLPDIGASLYRDVDEHRNDVRHQKLLEGGYYGEGEDICYFRGLLVTISYFALARAIWAGDLTITAYGNRVLESENSNPASLEEKQRTAASLRRLGNECLGETKRYIQHCCHRTPSNTTARRRYKRVHRKIV